MSSWTQKSLVQWTLRRLRSRIFTMSPGARLCLCTTLSNLMSKRLKQVSLFFRAAQLASSEDAVEASTSRVLSPHRETKFIIGFDFAVTLSSPESFSRSFRHHFRTIGRTEMANVEKKSKRWFQSSRVKFLLVRMSASWFLMSMYSICSVILNNIFTDFTLSLSTSQEYMIKERCWFSQMDFFVENFFHIGTIFCFFQAKLMSSTYTDKNNPFFHGVRTSIPIWQHSPNHASKFFSNCLSQNSPAKGWPYRFCWRRTTGSSILVHDLGHSCRGGRIQMSGHSDLGIFNNFGTSSIFSWVSEDAASAACPSQPGNLEMISMIFAAVIWDADDPCSANTE